MLIHSPSDVLRQLLINKGVLKLQTSTVWPSFSGNMPDMPDSLIVVFNTSPILQGRRMVDGYVIYKPGIQVLGRGADREALWTQIILVHDHLCKQVKASPVTYKGVLYRIDNASIASGPVDLGRDRESTRLRFFASVNATLTMARAA